MSIPNTFYKYLDFKGACGTIKNWELWWSDPRRFNDPFDCQIDHSRNALAPSVKATLLDCIARCAFDPAPPVFVRDMGFTKVLMHIRSTRPHTPSELRRLFSPMIDHAFQASVSHVSSLRSEFLTLARHMRVLCLASTPGDLLMWSHYAKAHTGAVLELRADADSASPLKFPKQVQYQDKVPVMFNDSDWAHWYLGMEVPNMGSRVAIALTTKSNAWKHENEWRCVRGFSTMPAEEQEGILPVPLIDEVRRIYLGARMTPTDRETLVELVRKRSPTIEILQAEVLTHEFGLSFRHFG